MKAALDVMVWEGLPDNQAAVKTGLTISAIRIALKQPHGRAYYREQLQVLRERESAANIHAMIRVRDQDDNKMASLNAAIALDRSSEAETHGARAMSLPGLQIVIVQGGSAAPARQHFRPG
jgi:hypothetical protein